MNSVLFKNKLRRLELLELQEDNATENIKIMVYRNHSFEMVASILNKFLNFSHLRAEILYSDYDDSFNFQYSQCNLNLIWIDLTRYNTQNIEAFIQERIEVLRENSNAPILFLYYADKELKLENIPSDCYVFATSEIISFLAEKAFDLTKEAYSGTKLSNAAALELARVIGLRFIPAIVKTPLKAIVVDLDNTLYQGILGEDGAENLIPNNNFQQYLKSQKDSGYFLCIASKNHEQDVIDLFKRRNDFILKWEDFTTSQINWESKPDNIVKIAQTLNINPDSILFIDDNPAEIQNVEMADIGVKTILARSEESVLSELKYYPGLLKLKKTKEDNLRVIDIKANQERVKFAMSLSPSEYFEKLGIKLIFSINNERQTGRVAELLGKTNQFIFTYKRYNETEILALFENKNSCVITAQMSDNLSDSGIIAIFIGEKDDHDSLVLDELVVSCRALGRNLENIMIPLLFSMAKNKLASIHKIKINYKKGERNSPAINWLENFTNNYNLMEEGCVEFCLPSHINTEGLTIEVI